MSLSPSSKKGDYVEVGLKEASTFHHGQNSTKDQKRNSRAPVTILSTLLIALGLALAQHFTYASLEGKPITSIAVSQAWISRLGIGLAFLVKVALSICVGVSFVQHSWMRLRQRPFKVSDVDTITSVLQNICCLVESTVWYRYPTLAIIALISWTIPLSALVTPSSLSVQPQRVVTSIPLQVPQPQYESSDYGFWSSTGAHYFLSTDPRLTRLSIYSASAQGQVPLRSDYQNQTYDLNFIGPAVKCSAANHSIILKASKQYGNNSCYDSEYTQFASWVPGEGLIGGGQDIVTLDYTSFDASRIYVMTNTGTTANKYTYASNATSSSTCTISMVNVTECLLYNTTYNADFAFRYPNQTHSLQTTSWLNPVPPLLPGFPQPTSNQGALPTAYLALMSVFGRLLVGTASYNVYNEEYTKRTSWNIINIDWSQTEKVQAGLEQLFQNITLSLLSDDAYAKNSSIAEFIPANVETWPNAYKYTRKNLFLAYGLSFLAALFCSLFGMRAFLANNASYRNVFSTYLRAIDSGGLARFTQVSDSGSYHLPADLRYVEVSMSGRELVEEDIELSRIGQARSKTFDRG